MRWPLQNICQPDMSVSECRFFGGSGGGKTETGTDVGIRTLKLVCDVRLIANVYQALSRPPPFSVTFSPHSLW